MHLVRGHGKQLKVKQLIAFKKNLVDEDVRFFVESWGAPRTILGSTDLGAQSCLLLLKTESVLRLHRRHKSFEVAVALNSVPS